MERMSEHTGLISSYQLLITAACTNTGSKTKGSHSRAADLCPFVPRHSLSQVTFFMQLGMLCVCPTNAWCYNALNDLVWHHQINRVNETVRQYVMSGLWETAWHICFQAITITNADGIACCCIRSPVIKVLIMQNKWFLDFHEGGRISITSMLNKCKERYVECKQTK